MSSSLWGWKVHDGNPLGREKYSYKFCVIFQHRLHVSKASFMLLNRVPQVFFHVGPIIYVTCRALAPSSPAMNMNVSSFLAQAFVFAQANIESTVNAC